MKWTWPFVPRTQHDAVLADRERIRGERNQFKQDRDTARYNREQALRQLAEADANNRRVHERNLELGRRISALAESDPEHAAQLERQVAELRKRVARLEKELDNACGMPPGGILNSAPWQPGYKAVSP